MTALHANKDRQGLRDTPMATVLTSSLLVAPLVYLTADSIYAVRGWDDATAGVVHVLGAVAYGFVALAIASWLPPTSRLSMTVVVTGLIGMAGNVAYGFEAIHSSFGDVPLVDRPGAANLIKPLGLFFPLFIAMTAWALTKLGCRWQAFLVLLASVAWPVAHIGNIAPLAVAVNVVLVVGFGGLLWDSRAVTPPGGADRRG